jgi:hypothetical protein
MIAMTWEIWEDDAGRVQVKVRGGSGESTPKEQAFIFALQEKVQEMLDPTSSGTFITRFEKR